MTTHEDALALVRAGALLNGLELAAVLGISQSQLRKLEHARAFDLFKVQPALGQRCYSGVLIGRYLSGDPLVVPTFGRKRHSA